jgi:PadR family transcriptional regulator PadR
MPRVARTRPKHEAASRVRPASASANEEAPDVRFLYAGLIRMHVLHHAAHEPIFGLGMIEELARHGYRLSAGTLYPILHGLAERGLLDCEEERAGRSRRKIYRATAAGRAALAAATHMVGELFRELVEE